DDYPGAIANLFEHYEEHGSLALQLLMQEHVPSIGPVTQAGRALHAEWVERVFAGHLRSLAPEARSVRLCQLIALTDVYNWKLLRRDLHLEHEVAEQAMLEMIVALIGRRKPS